MRINRKLNYQHLLYFWSVVRTGSLTQASRELALSAQAISPQLTFWYWKPANLDATTLVTVGFNPGDIAFFCGSVTRAGTVNMPDSVANQEAGTPILVCSHLRESLNATWPSLRSFN